MTEININVLQQARYMGLKCPPAFSQAKRFVDNIINIILKSEQRTSARKPDAATALKSAVGLIVGDLIIVGQTSEASWSYLSLSTAAFSDRPIGYKTFKPTIKAMEAAGLIEISLGRNSQANDFGGGQKSVYTPSLATRLKPTHLMVPIAKEVGIGD